MKPLGSLIVGVVAAAGMTAAAINVASTSQTVATPTLPGAAHGASAQKIAALKAERHHLAQRLAARQAAQATTTMPQPSVTAHATTVPATWQVRSSASWTAQAAPPATTAPVVPTTSPVTPPPVTSPPTTYVDDGGSDGSTTTIPGIPSDS